MNAIRAYNVYFARTADERPGSIAWNVGILCMQAMAAAGCGQVCAVHDSMKWPDATKNTPPDLGWRIGTR
jgi:hypothetical protein